jgi:competence protein ComEC
MFAGQISLTALPANLLAAPAIPIATVGGLVAALTAPAAPWLADAAAWAGNAGAAWVGQVATWVAAWPAAAIAWPLGLGGLILAAGASLAAGLLAWRLGRRRRAAQVLIGLLATALAIQALLPRAWIDSALAGRVTADWLFAACDVGQGTAAVLRTGERSAVMVDVGPADAALGRCLRRLKVETLDAIILTHFHADHVGGLEEAIRGRRVAQLVHGPACGQLTAARQVEALAQQAAIPIQTVADAPLSSTAGSLKLTVYPSPLAAQCPSKSEGGGESAANNAGLAVLGQIDGHPFWLLGDLEAEGQTALLRTLGTSQPVGGVVVVAHHGSANQSGALARALAPQIAVMSAGQDNPYGHPSPAALELYGDLAKVRRTDTEGLIVIGGEDLDLRPG